MEVFYLYQCENGNKLRELLKEIPFYLLFQRKRHASIHFVGLNFANAKIKFNIVFADFLFPTNFKKKCNKQSNIDKFIFCFLF